MLLTIPEFSLVLLIGPSGAGKSRFAAQHFAPTEVIAAQRARALLADDENDAEPLFADFARSGVHEVVCQEKHLGARAVAVVCRDAQAAARRFGADGGECGLVYTRTGRRFFAAGDALEPALLARVREALEQRRIWERLHSEWVCLDCELLPATAQTGARLREPCAPTGATAHRRGWDMTSLDDLRLAPFHLLASEGAVHVDRDHGWHLDTLAELVEADPALLRATAMRRVELADAHARAAAVAWWETLTEAGGEGMVVKPLRFLERGPRGLVQPALKCRSRESLRLLCGPDSTAPEPRQRRRRDLARRRALALGELSLGIEALERFVRREPLHRVHECVLGVLALESQPVDPRL
jgi:protein phosphatase